MNHRLNSSSPLNANSFGQELFVSKTKRATDGNVPEKLKQVVKELLETEMAYVESLNDVKRGYIEPLRKEKSFSISDEKKVFSNLTDIAAFHGDFHQRLNQWNDKVDSLGTIFCDSANLLFRLYSPYCVSYVGAISYLEELRIKQTSKWKCIVACQTRLQHALPLATYLLKPIQRILKYHLLLQEMDKAYQNSSVAIQRAIQSMVQVADKLNGTMELHQLNAKLLQHLCQLNHPRLPPSQVHQLGTLVLYDQFRLLGKRRPRFVWLFYSAMLLGKPRTWDASSSTSINGVMAQLSTATPDQVFAGASAMASSGLVLKQIIQCKNLMLIESISDEPLCFHVVPFDNPKGQVTIQAQNATQKRLWCQQIKRLILEHYDKAIPERARKMLLNIGDGGNHKTTFEGPSLDDTASVVAIEAVTFEDDLMSLNHEILQMLHTYQPLPKQTHCRHPSSVTLDLISLWDNVVTSCTIPCKDSFTHSTTVVDKPIATNHNVQLQTRSVSNATLMRKEASSEMLKDMDFRYITVEINEERLLLNSNTNIVKMGGSSREEKVFIEPSSLKNGYLEEAREENEDTSIYQTVSTNSSKSGGSISSSISHDSHKEGEMINVYEAYIARARSNVELTLDDLEEILRPLTGLRVGATSKSIPLTKIADCDKRESSLSSASIQLSSRCDKLASMDRQRSSSYSTAPVIKIESTKDSLYQNKYESSSKIWCPTKSSKEPIASVTLPKCEESSQSKAPILSKPCSTTTTTTTEESVSKQSSSVSYSTTMPSFSRHTVLHNSSPNTLPLHSNSRKSNVPTMKVSAFDSVPKSQSSPSGQFNSPTTPKSVSTKTSNQSTKVSASLDHETATFARGASSCISRTEHDKIAKQPITVHRGSIPSLNWKKPDPVNSVRQNETQTKSLVNSKLPASQTNIPEQLNESHRPLKPPRSASLSHEGDESFLPPKGLVSSMRNRFQG